MGAHAAKLVYAGESSQHNPITYFNMTTQLGTIGYRGVMSQAAIMGNMDIGHDPVVIA
jgi:hypothetical protein